MQLHLTCEFSHARSKQPAATKIQILAASLILCVSVDANEAASLHRGENAKCLTCFSHFFAFPHRNSAKKRIQTSPNRIRYHISALSWPTL
jgi:hypothetical protein